MASTYFPTGDLFETAQDVVTTDIAVNSNNEAIAVGQTDDNNVLIQRFNADGTPRGNTIELGLNINAETPVVDIADDGSFVISYARNKAETIQLEDDNEVTINHRDVVVRTFNAEVSELRDAIVIGGTTQGGIPNADEFAPDVQIDDNGNIAVVGVRRAISLQDGNVTRDPGEIWIVAYDRQGNEISELDFVTDTENLEERDPQFALRNVLNPSDLSAIVSYTTTEDGIPATVSYQRYQNNLGEDFETFGDPVAISDLVTSSTQRESSVAINDLGEYIVTWTDNSSGTGEIRSLLVTEETINRNITETEGAVEGNSSVDIADDGGYVIAYENQTDGTVEYREFSENAEPLREAQVIEGLQSNPSVGLARDGMDMTVAGVTDDGTLGVQSFQPTSPAGADFNNDGNSDILWRNRVTGENGVWLMDETVLDQSVPFEAQDNTDWRIQGTGDFNDDGVTDFFWRNQVTGENGIWLMNESSTILDEVVTLQTEANTDWYVGGIADFNGDGQEDLLWRNQETGANGFWFMDGTEFQESSPLLGQDNVDWDIYGTGDFDNDGNTDILWRNGTTGANGVWLMNGTDVIRPEEIEPQDNPQWYIGGTGDFNSDGNVDILWRNRDTGANGIWQMDGLNFTNSLLINSQDNNDWRMIPMG